MGDVLFMDFFDDFSVVEHQQAQDEVRGQSRAAAQYDIDVHLEIG